MAKAQKTPALLPKRIGGVKVPKSVRKGRFGELLASQTGQTLLAEAVQGANGRSTVIMADPGLRSFAEHIAERLQQEGDREAATAALAFALGEAARTFINALDEHQRVHAQSLKAAAPPAQTTAGSKQKRSSSTAPPP